VRAGNIAVALIWAATLTSVGSSRTSAQNTDCAPPEHTLETLKSRLLYLAETRSSGIEALVLRAVAPQPPDICPVLPANQDRQASISDLVRFIVSVENNRLTRSVMSGIRVALRSESADRLDLPVSDLVFGVEHARSAIARGESLYTLQDFSTDTRARNYLVQWARSRCGPDSWPELPLAIVTNAYLVPDQRNAALRQALESNPAGIANPRARHIVEQRGIGRGHPNARRLPSINDRPCVR
jgi:hypothetical protein